MTATTYRPNGYDGEPNIRVFGKQGPYSAIVSVVGKQRYGPRRSTLEAAIEDRDKMKYIAILRNTGGRLSAEQLAHIDSFKSAEEALVDMFGKRNLPRGVYMSRGRFAARYSDSDGVEKYVPGPFDSAEEAAAARALALKPHDAIRAARRVAAGAAEVVRIDTLTLATLRAAAESGEVLGMTVENGEWHAVKHFGKKKVRLGTYVTAERLVLERLLADALADHAGACGCDVGEAIKAVEAARGCALELFLGSVDDGAGGTNIRFRAPDAISAWQEQAPEEGGAQKTKRMRQDYNGLRSVIVCDADGEEEDDEAAAPSAFTAAAPSGRLKRGREAGNKASAEQREYAAHSSDDESEYDSQYSSNHCVRIVSLSGVTTTAAGQLGRCGHKDGLAHRALFNKPRAAFPRKGGREVVVVEECNLRWVRVLDEAGWVSTKDVLIGMGQGISADFLQRAAIEEAQLLPDGETMLIFANLYGQDPEMGEMEHDDVLLCQHVLHIDLRSMQGRSLTSTNTEVYKWYHLCPSPFGQEPCAYATQSAPYENGEVVLHLDVTGGAWEAKRLVCHTHGRFAGMINPDTVARLGWLDWPRPPTAMVTNRAPPPGTARAGAELVLEVSGTADYYDVPPSRLAALWPTPRCLVNLGFQVTEEQWRTLLPVLTSSAAKYAVTSAGNLVVLTDPKSAVPVTPEHHIGHGLYLLRGTGLAPARPQYLHAPPTQAVNAAADFAKALWESDLQTSADVVFRVFPRPRAAGTTADQGGAGPGEPAGGGPGGGDGGGGDGAAASSRSGSVGQAGVPEKLRAHRFMLCARSRYFRAMFGNESVEASSGVVTLRDVSPAAVRCILHYIYTGQLRLAPLQAAEGVTAGQHALPAPDGRWVQPSGSADGPLGHGTGADDDGTAGPPLAPLDAADRRQLLLDVLEMSQRYQLDRLHEACTQEAVDALSTEDAVEWLVAAHVNQFIRLRNLAMARVIERYAGLDAAQRELLSQHAGLAREVMDMVLL